MQKHDTGEDARPADAGVPPPDSVIFEWTAGELRQTTPSPGWLDRVRAHGGGASSITDTLPYLDSFLPDAARFWDGTQEGELVSDFWTQTDASGSAIHLLAYALAVDGQRLLMIRSVDDLYRKSEQAQQNAHASVKQWKLAALRQRALEKLATPTDSSESAPNETETRDSLTGVASYQYFEQQLIIELQSANERDETLSLLYLDIDQFQQLNDQYGRNAGDAYLRTVGQLIEGALLNPKDVAARAEGDEFATLLPGTDGPGAVRLAHTLSGMIRNLRVPNPFTPGLLSATVSIGVVTRPAGGEATADRLLSCVKSAVRDAKRSGRDRIVIGTYPI